MTLYKFGKLTSSACRLALMNALRTLADADNQGKLNVLELNGNNIPDKLPVELMPPLHRNLDTSVNFIKIPLWNEPSNARLPLGLDVPVLHLSNCSSLLLQCTRCQWTSGCNGIQAHQWGAGWWLLCISPPRLEATKTTKLYRVELRPMCLRMPLSSKLHASQVP